jgi:hypothetical protein
MVLKWMDKKPVSFISTFHDAIMMSEEKRGKVISKPKCIRQYNKHMGGVDIKDQKLQSYLVERTMHEVVSEDVQKASEHFSPQCLRLP